MSDKKTKQDGDSLVKKLLSSKPHMVCGRTDCADRHLHHLRSPIPLVELE